MLKKREMTVEPLGTPRLILSLIYIMTNDQLSTVAEAHGKIDDETFVDIPTLHKSLVLN